MTALILTCVNQNVLCKTWEEIVSLSSLLASSAVLLCQLSVSYCMKDVGKLKKLKRRAAGTVRCLENEI